MITLFEIAKIPETNTSTHWTSEIMTPKEDNLESGIWNQNTSLNFAFCFLSKLSINRHSVCVITAIWEPYKEDKLTQELLSLVSWANNSIFWVLFPTGPGINMKTIFYLSFKLLMHSLQFGFIYLRPKSGPARWSQLNCLDDKAAVSVIRLLILSQWWCHLSVLRFCCRTQVSAVSTPYCREYPTSSW